MLKVASIQDPQKNIIAPSIYIDGVEREGSYYTIHYSLMDDANANTNNAKPASWMSNQEVLNSLSVYISDGITTEKRLLNTLYAANVVKNNTIKDYTILYNTSSDVSITAWVGNSDISSSIVSEDILIADALVSASYENQSFNYINKIKDLGILNYDVSINPRLPETKQTPLQTDLLVSYRPDKVANLGFSFSVKRYLTDNSPSYNILKGNENYKNIILANSKINAELSFFSKKNLTKKEKDYKKIENKTYTSLIDLTDAIYYVGVVDDNKSKSDRSYYDIKVKLQINDYSKKFIGETISNNLKNDINFIIEYKNIFITTSSDKNILDPNVYIFENMYEAVLSKVETFINNTAPLCNLFYGISIDRYAGLFASILHPLTTRIELLEKLLTFLNKLQNTIRTISSVQSDGSGIPNVTSGGDLIFERQFGKSDENPYLADLNYDYDENYGIEVLSADSLNIRLSEQPTPIKEITLADLESRKALESRKYFNRPLTSTTTNINLFSIASITFGREAYQILIDLPQQSTTIYNDLYLRLKEYNNFSFNYKKPETYIFQLLSKGINIKTILNRNNNSTNNLESSTVFDSNEDTKERSLKFMTDTNIKDLYFYLDEQQFKSIENIKDSQQYAASQNNLGQEGSIFTFNVANLLNPNLKAKTFVYYNCFYSFSGILGTSNSDLDIYRIDENCVSDLFTDKLRLFTGFFAVRKARNQFNSKVQTIPLLQNDLKINIPPAYLNRTVQDASINVSIDEL